MRDFNGNKETQKDITFENNKNLNFVLDSYKLDVVTWSRNNQGFSSNDYGIQALGLCMETKFVLNGKPGEPTRSCNIFRLTREQRHCWSNPCFRKNLNAKSNLFRLRNWIYFQIISQFFFASMQNLELYLI